MLNLIKMNSSYNEFRAEILKLSKPKRFKTTKTLHSKYIIRSVRKQYKESRILPEDTYSQLIRRIHELLIQELFENGSLKLPYRMGTVHITSLESKTYIVDGELIRTTPVNWKDTLKLWYSNEKARAKKVLLRDTPHIVYTIKWSRSRVGFKNQQYYKFLPCRALKLKLKEVVNTKGVPSYEH